MITVYILSGKDIRAEMLSKLKPRIQQTFSPVALAVGRAGVKPNHLSIAGLIAGILAAACIAFKLRLIGASLLMISGALDIFDGLLARSLRELQSEFGGFLDSMADRYVDIMIFISLGLYGVNWILILLAMSGALLVSYARARAEMIIDKCDIGVAERGERIIVLLFGLVSGHITLSLVIIAIFSHLTALQRIAFTYRQCKILHRQEVHREDSLS